jgi:hypothetical protein
LCAAALLLGVPSESAALLDGPPAVRIHYLGHAAFVLQLGPALTVVTDLGQSRAYDLESPVHGLLCELPV